VNNSVRWPLVVAAGLGAAAATAPAAAQARPEHPNIILATTTSVYDTGLLDSIVPIFEHEAGYHVRVVAVGSGQALAMARRGDADVVLVHSPAAELAFMQAGYGVRRRVVATNFFTIAGPAADPAGVRGAAGAPDALRRIAAAGQRFVSRGDSSGTNARELALWRAAGGRPRWRGYIETGQGMAATLLVANERRAYTLTDRATLASLRGKIDLVALRGLDPELRNVYHVIELNAAGHPRMNVAGGTAFADFMVSAEAQAFLARFGESRIGEPMFVPAWGKEPGETGREGFRSGPTRRGAQPATRVAASSLRPIATSDRPGQGSRGSTRRNSHTRESKTLS
jgi:tungstate transport system substrate-binding protein